MDDFVRRLLVFSQCTALNEANGLILTKCEVFFHGL